MYNMTISISKKYVLNDVKQVNNMKAISKNTCKYNNISYIAIIQGNKYMYVQQNVDTRGRLKYTVDVTHSIRRSLGTPNKGHF